MLSGLMLTALLMGLGGIPHCAAMCGGACATVLRKPVPLLALLGRCLGYAILGAVAATGVSGLGWWAQHAAVLQPVWLLAQVSALVLGLWLVWTARMPAVVDQWGQAAYRSLQARVPVPLARSSALLWLSSILAGMLWAALPCGLLYGAVLVAALGNGPVDGALVMLAFALPSAVGLWAAPWLLVRMGWSSGEVVPVAGVSMPIAWLRPDKVASASEVSEGAVAKGCLPRPGLRPRNGVGFAWRTWADPGWAVRLSGLMLTLMTSWAIYHRLLAQWQAWCV